MIRCVGCHCTDVSPCRDENSPNGWCFWIVEIEETQTGLCSICAVKPIDELIAAALSSRLIAA